MTSTTLRVTSALALFVAWQLVFPASAVPAPGAVRDLVPPPPAGAAPAQSILPPMLFTIRSNTSFETLHTNGVGANSTSWNDLRSNQAASEDRIESGATAATAPVHSWRRLLRREVTPAIVRRANELIRIHHEVGEEVAFVADGQQYLARIEEHYHPPGGDKFPWGPHPGVSVFTARPSSELTQQARLEGSNPAVAP